MKSILDKDFRYTNAASTDIRKTFERIRKQQKREKESGNLGELINVRPVAIKPGDTITFTVGKRVGSILPLRRKGAK